MNQDLSLKKITKLIARFFLRFHVITFSVLVAVGLSLIIYSASQIILDSSEPQIITDIPHAGFDKATIDQLESLSERSSDTKPLTFPANERVNPFSE